MARRSPKALAERAGVSGTRCGGWIVGGPRRPLPAPPRGTGGPARRPQARERRRCVIRSSRVVCSVRALGGLCGHLSVLARAICRLRVGLGSLCDRPDGGMVQGASPVYAGGDGRTGAIAPSSPCLYPRARRSPPTGGHLPCASPREAIDGTPRYTIYHALHAETLCQLQRQEVLVAIATRLLRGQPTGKAKGELST